jgi:hypothetical protein
MLIVGFNSPIAYRYSNDIEAGILDLPEIVERDKAIPVRLQCVDAALVPKLLASMSGAQD